ncbi:hypothetical protein GCM10010430_18930 [Kitasatospora cystarginea]|uniref:Uncharacterized protein n=1 Tax=Kitasatospora cystarginea TaxID=58350 RepID=A0ABP5QJU3_9ACTN
MRYLIALALLWALRRLLPAKGRHRTPDLRQEICGWAGPIPAHVLARTMPLDPDNHLIVRPYVLLWEEELQRQEERREALFAASAGLPDTSYTYPGAHSLPGAAA